MHIELAVLVLLSLVSAGVAVAASVLHHSTLRSREVATRRVLGARRSQIARMFLSENVVGIAAGLVIGTLAMLAAGESRHLSSPAVLLVAAAAIAGGWIAGRQAAKVPFSKSGLFRTGSDTRGHSWLQ